MESYTFGVICDFVESFVNCYKKEIAKETNKNIGPIEDSAGFVVDASSYIAGSNTASSSLAWFLLYMVLYSEVQAKVHEGLVIVLGKDCSPCWKDA